VAVVLTCGSVQGQEVSWGGKCQPPSYVPLPSYTPCPAPFEPPSAEPTPPAPAPVQPAPLTQAPDVSPLAFGATDTGETFAAVSTAVGYIDPALPISQVRIRADAAWNDTRPDRAEFFYAKDGPPFPVAKLNYQELSSYIEFAPVKQASVFIDVPVRFVEFQPSTQTNGLSDMNVGAKYAFIYSPTRIVTAQFRTYIPTGRADKGLGTDHVSLEPALLFYQQLRKRLSMEGEFRDWIPVGGNDFSGNIIRYGLGVNYRVYDNGRIRVFPVTEFVGWTMLSGRESLPLDVGIEEVAGQTIVNGKFGVRVGFGELAPGNVISRADFYAGYGRALTGDWWYRDMMRFEFRLRY
jgi:hypothetical protein